MATINSNELSSQSKCDSFKTNGILIKLLKLLFIKLLINRKIRLMAMIWRETYS
jgi:hypothetical protein